MKSDYRNFLYYIKFVEEELEKIEMLEHTLSVDDDPEESAKLEAAGIERMNKFEELNVVDELTVKYGVSWDVVYSWSYEEIYTKLLRGKTKAAIQKQVQKQSVKK